MSVIPFRKLDRVVIVKDGIGAFTGKTGTVTALAFRTYRRGNKKSGWYATVVVDAPESPLAPSIDDEARRTIVLHIDGLRSAARHRAAAAS